MDEALLARVEDVGLNASAPPQQRWLDGWLLRFSPGKAKRARCINALAAGCLPLDERLRLAAEVYRQAELPMLVRITRFTQPPQLDAQLAERGFAARDDTRVMVCAALVDAPPAALPPGTHWATLGAADFAQAVGALRQSPLPQRAAHAQRLLLASPSWCAFAIRGDDDGRVLACGLYAREAEWAGLYDVFTAPPERGRGLARLLCTRMLAAARQAGAARGCLQVEGDNHSARRIYAQLGFADAYAYHYRVAPG